MFSTVSCEVSWIIKYSICTNPIVRTSFNSWMFLKPCHTIKVITLLLGVKRSQPPLTNLLIYSIIILHLLTLATIKLWNNVLDNVANVIGLSFVRNNRFIKQNVRNVWGRAKERSHIILNELINFLIIYDNGL